MRSSLRTRGDSLLSVAALVAILMWIITSDPWLESQMTRHVQGTSIAVGDMGTYLQKVPETVAAAQSNSLEFGHAWTFLVLAAVLTVWMFRT